MGFDDYNFNNDNGADVVGADFHDDNVRKNFTKKVTGLLGVQLLITFGFVSIATLGRASETNPDGFQMGVGLFSPGLVWTSLVLSFVLLIGATCCCQSMLRKAPHNLGFLLVWTLLESHVIAACGLQYAPMAVMQAMGTCAAITLLIAALVSFTSFDFSKLLPIMFAVLMTWVICTFFLFLFGIQMDQAIKGYIGATIFTIFLAIDMKMVLGGGKYIYAEDDYVLAVINIYLDIINLFLYLLQIFGSND